MNDLLALLRPRLLSFKNGSASASAGNRRLRYLLFAVIGIAFWIGVFLIFYRVLTYFQGVEEFGDILARKLLSMVLLTFFSLLVFSSIVASLSKLYLSHDLILVHSLPVSAEKIFLARWLESTVDSSWMVMIFSLPVFLSYGIVYDAGAIFYATAGMALIPLCLIASALSTLVVVVAAVLLPAGRIRTVFVFFGLLLIMALILAFRLMRPERLVNPETFATLVLYLREMGTPGSPLLPTTWVVDSLNAGLSGFMGPAIFHLSLLWSCAAALAFIVTWVAGAFYYEGYTNAQTTAERLFPLRAANRGRSNRFFDNLSGPAWAFAAKEFRTFFRDQTQWPQLFLIAALIVIYLYNFSVLPLGAVTDQNDLPAEYLFLPEHGSGSLRPDGGGCPIRLSGGQLRRVCLLDRPGGADLIADLSLGQIYRLLSPSARPDGDPHRELQYPSSGDAVYDGSVGRHDFPYGAGRSGHGGGLRRGISRLSLRESGSVGHQLRRASVHALRGGFHCSGDHA